MGVVQFAIQSYKHPSAKLSAQQLVNFYAEAQPPDAKSPVVIQARPGVDAFATVGTGPIRGIHFMHALQAVFVASGQALYRLESDGTSTNLGDVLGVERVFMRDNRTQLMVLTGAATTDPAYIYSVAGGLVQITDPDFIPSEVGAYQDGYFLTIDDLSFGSSDLNDGTSWVATNRGTPAGESDCLVSILSKHREVWLFGNTSIEIWYNFGGTGGGFPFRRISGSFIERGCGAPFSPAVVDNNLCWLGEDNMVWRSSGYNAERISQHAIEAEISGFTVKNDAFGMSFTVNGHKLYALTFPTADKTFVWDASTLLWHEWKSANTGRWLANGAVSAFGKVLIGHFQTGQVGALNPNTFTEFGDTLEGIATAPSIHNDRRRLFHNSFELDMDVGVGVVTGQGSDPQVMLDWSKDGGNTFTPAVHPRSIGKIGTYKTRVRWMGMGSDRERVYRARITDPVSRRIIRAHADISMGLS